MIAQKCNIGFSLEFNLHIECELSHETRLVQMPQESERDRALLMCA